MTESHNNSLLPYNTLGIDAGCSYRLDIANIDDARKAVEFARQRDLPILFLGAGSNVVFSGDFSGVVGVNKISELTEVEVSTDASEFRVGGGINWHRFVCYTNERGFRGLENLALIPGTVGAAPVQNIGAYGEQVANHIVGVEVFEPATGKVSTLSPGDCKFGYRDSIFKRNPGKYFISSVTFSLTRSRPLTLTYGEVAQQQAHKPFQTAMELNEFICATRVKKLPDPAVLPNAGSFFKNPVVSDSQFEILKKTYPGIVGYPDQQGIKLAAGWMIEQAGWKGFRNKTVGVHDQQALVLINHSHGSGLDILTLARQIQASIQAKFSVSLEIEPVLI